MTYIIKYKPKDYGSGTCEVFESTAAQALAYFKTLPLIGKCKIISCEKENK